MHFAEVDSEQDEGGRAGELDDDLEEDVGAVCAPLAVARIDRVFSQSYHAFVCGKRTVRSRSFFSSTTCT